MQMPDISRRRALGYVLAVLAVLLVGGHFVAGGSRQPAPDALAASPLRPSAPAKPRLLVVDVVGEVRHPGLYKLSPESRVDDALRAAGGATPTAALDAINLASPIADGEQIVVPSSDGASRAAGAAPSGAGSPGAPAEKVHLNSATLEELDSLPGVGPVTAQKILAYREQHGAFHSVDELDAVPGIGPARLQDLKPLVEL